MNMTITLMSFGYLVATILVIIILRDRKKFSSYKNTEKKINQTSQQVEKKLSEEKENWNRDRKKKEKELLDRQRELRGMEQKYNQRLNSLDKRLESLDKKETFLLELEKNSNALKIDLEKKEKDLQTLMEQETQKLCQIASLSKEKALALLMDKIKEEAREKCVKDVKQIIEDIKQNSQTEATKILATSMQRLSLDYTSEATLNLVSIPNEEMKGRIIGREGRNIRTFEKVTGTEVIIDDTPGAISISCFDGVRKEIARITLEKLILDGRIHPGRIEELYKKTKKEVEEQLIKIGKNACNEMNIHNLSPNLISIIGKLQYRTSYGQNILQHSIECAWIAGMIAAELGLNQKIAKRAGFLHDIGKAIDHEIEGSHALIGANLARKNGETPIIVNAIESHHEEVEKTSVYSVLAQIADSVSGSRPGARKEVIEAYIQRLAKLEEIANSTQGVNSSYAIQAGREIRVIVNPEDVDDSKTIYIADDIAKKIEKEVQYPGQIKVTVIREKISTSTAK